MERDEILDGKRIDPRIEKIDKLTTDTADKILEIAIDRLQYPSKSDIEVLLRQYARDFGELLIFGVISERKKG